MLTEYTFWFLSFLAVFSAFAVILSRNPVHSVLYLILTFFSIAGHYFLLNAQFLAAVHIIVYAGAIMVLFLYVVMMLNLNQAEPQRTSAWAKFLGAGAAGILMLVMIAVIRKAEQGTPAGLPVNAGTVENLGITLYRDFLLPFELASVLFLGAMVGAVYLSKKEIT
ncbi:MAG: NADH-quinone oxidoreductase subunit J [Crocinitomicaceae bacterium]|nr:NADH-quinone oxidoreductase subunit J [Crocinitomicaceae bacterium]